MSLATYNPAPFGAGDIISEFLRGKTEGTIRAYSADLRRLGEFIECEDHGAIARRVLASHSEANRIALAWRGAMVEEGLAPSTINRRLAALRSLIRFARLIGRVTWTIDVEGLRVVAFRDARGLSWKKYLALLEKVESVRDLAMLRLAGDRGLRREEIVTLDRSHLEERCEAVWVAGKGRGGQRERVALAEETSAALCAWLAERGDGKGPLFGGRGKGSRLSVSQLWRVFGKYGVRPHQLRHTCATRVAEVTNGNTYAVKAVLRHGSVSTSQVYVDGVDDLAAEAAQKMQG